MTYGPLVCSGQAGGSDVFFSFDNWHFPYLEARAVKRGSSCFVVREIRSLQSRLGLSFDEEMYVALSVEWKPQAKNITWGSTLMEF